MNVLTSTRVSQSVECQRGHIRAKSDKQNPVPMWDTDIITRASHVILAEVILDFPGRSITELLS